MLQWFTDSHSSSSVSVVPLHRVTHPLQRSACNSYCCQFQWIPLWLTGVLPWELIFYTSGISITCDCLVPFQPTWWFSRWRYTCTYMINMCVHDQHVCAWLLIDKRVPPEVWEQIFNHLYPSQLSRMSMVNNNRNRIVSSLSVWSRMFSVVFGPTKRLRLLRNIPESKSFTCFICARAVFISARSVLV